jgi:uncharacterized membrane protein
MNTATRLRLAHQQGDTLEWRFKRNCSVTPSQLGAMYGLLCVISLTVAGFFWSMGVHLVLPFTALELMAVAIAFVVYARHATDRERITLSPHSLLIEQECAGRISQIVFNRAWVRMQDRQSPRELIELSEGNRRLQCGHHIRLDLREQVAQEIRWALKGF